MSIQAEFWGPYASFNRPELKAERVSYDVPTPSAARGMLEAIYWHPGLRWHVDRIYVLNPIATTNIRRNEVKSKISARNVRTAMAGGQTPLPLAASQEILQRAALVLKDVHYVVEAHFEMTDKAAPGDNAGKFQDIMRRRLEKGQCYHQPCFGCREFPAAFKRWEGGTPPSIAESRDLGYMLFDLDYSDPQNIQPTFFHARLKNGVLEVDGQEVVR